MHSAAVTGQALRIFAFVNLELIQFKRIRQFIFLESPLIVFDEGIVSVSHEGPRKLSVLGVPKYSKYLREYNPILRPRSTGQLNWMSIFLFLLVKVIF